MSNAGKPIVIEGWVIVNGRDVRGPIFDYQKHPQFPGVFHRRKYAQEELHGNRNRIVKVRWEVPSP